MRSLREAPELRERGTDDFSDRLHRQLDARRAANVASERDGGRNSNLVGYT
jgi:hypothetical protein